MPDLNRTQFARAEDLFFAARGLPPADRSAYLADACGDDPDVRAEVLRLLACDVPDAAPGDVLTPLIDQLSATRALAGVDAATRPSGPDPATRLGSRVGPYELTNVRGRGGMGVVFEARDSRLDRCVAVKALSPNVGGGTAGLARLLREAKLLASISHPNIATVFGLEESAGEHFIVLELLDGGSLAQRLKADGAMPVPDAVRLCAGIAAAVDAAHAAGIIHRDLKPGNVMFTADGRPKVLDFGLAREVPSAAGSRGRSGSAGHAQSATVDRLTRDGAVMGTPGYMSPEQLRGHPVDRRTDVFALGCILYECLAGRVAFPGDTFADASAAVLHADPDWSRLPADVPPPVRRLLRRCLAKDADHRLRDMGDVRLELEEALVAQPDAPPAEPRWRWRTTAQCLTSAGVAALSVIAFVQSTGKALWTSSAAPAATRPAASNPAAADDPGENGDETAPPASTRPMLRPGSRIPNLLGPSSGPIRRLSVPFPGNRPQDDLPHVRLALSRNGGKLVVSAADDVDHRLWLRDLDKTEWHRVEDSVDAWMPAFSPDGNSLVYCDAGGMYKRPVAGGSPTRLADLSGFFGGYHWAKDGYVSYVPYWGRGVVRVSADRGSADAKVVTNPDNVTDFAHVCPVTTADGTHVIYAVWDGRTKCRIDAANLSTKQRHTVVDQGTSPRIANTKEGPLLTWEHGGTIYAAGLDAATVKPKGPGVVVATGVLVDRSMYHAAYDVADDGTLAYVPGPSFSEESRLSWLDLSPSAASTRPAAPVPFNDERLSFAEPSFGADGWRVCVILKGDLYRPYVYDLGRGSSQRVVFDGDCVAAAISPDGRHVAAAVNKDGPYALWVRRLSDGSDVKLDDGLGLHPNAIAWSPDGRYIAYSTTAAGQYVRDVYVVDLKDRSKKPWVFAGGPREERAPRFSPDGRWLAYASDDSGTREVYARSFPDGAKVFQMSAGGGDWPEWSPDGKSVYYRARSGLMAVPVNQETGGPGGPPVIKYAKRFGQADFELSDYTVAPDGRLLIVEPSERGPRAPHVNVVLNWHTQLGFRPHWTVKK